MNFFQSQANARSQTKRLIFLFALAVLSLVILTNLLVMGINGYLNLEGQALTLSYFTEQFDWLTFSIIGAIVVTFILVGSIYKTASLSGGGKVVAQSLDGTLINHSTNNLQYKTLLNVVEEMAIASGTPVPQVYVLQKEQAINAFAAGFSTDDAVIGITQGALDCFNRDELQGVIAHEFSHVANGDMRLNMRLTGILHGILLIGLLGYFIMRASAVGRRSKDGNKLIFLGLGLLVIGYGGTFFGNAIKATVSRQREYLADASAVQYTRNNVGIANALKKIGGYEAGSKLDTPEAQSMSHAFFSNALSKKFISFLSTHPPLTKRIKALQPSWTGEFSKTRVLNDAEIKANAAGFSSFAGSNESGATQTTDSIKNIREKSDQGMKNQTALLAGIGQLSDTRIALAKTYLQDIPKELLETVRSPVGAQAYVYALLLSDKSAHDKFSGKKNKLQDDKVLSRQWEYLLAYLPSEIYSQTKHIFEEVHALDIKHRLPLLEIAMPHLRQMHSQRYEAMLTQMKYLVFVDSELSIFEWSITNIVANYLKTEFETADTKRVKYSSAQEVRQHIEVMLSALLNEFCAQHEHQIMLKKAEDILRLSHLRLRDEKSVSIEDFAGAVSSLRLLDFNIKEKLLQLCMVAVTQDKEYTPQEHEVLRAVSECLGCPMPPDVGDMR